MPPLRCGGTVGMEVFGLRGVFVVVVVVVVVIVIVTSGMGEYQVPIPSGFSADDDDDGGTASTVMEGTASWGTEILDRRRCRGDPEVERVVAVPVAVPVAAAAATGAAVVAGIEGWTMTERRRPGTGEALTGRRRCCWEEALGETGAAAASKRGGATIAEVEGFPMNNVCFFFPGDCPSSVRKAEG